MELLNSISVIPNSFHYLIATGVFVGAILLFVFGFKSVDEPDFRKGKVDSKLAGKKKKGKEKKSENGTTSPTKANLTPKATPKVVREIKEISSPQKNKKNYDSKANADFNDEDGNWQQALIHKKKNLGNALSAASGDKGLGDQQKKKGKKDDRHQNKNMKKDSVKMEKLPMDDGDGEWQEAKKKRRAFQKRDYS